MLEAISTFVDLLNALRDRAIASRLRDPRTTEKVCKALRLIYFPPDGITALLKEVDAGRQPSADRIAAALTQFSDAEWRVKEALKGLNFSTLQHELGISIADARKLDLIRMGKYSLRQSVQDEINAYGQRGYRPDPQKIKALLREIERLNLSIEETDKAIGDRMR